MARWLIVVLLLVTTAAFAHPPVSIVFDSRGNLYYSDLDQVWRVAPDGTRSVAVPNVHTHELAIDAQDRLYGEDVTNVGENFSHSFWMRTPDGRLTKLIGPKEGFPSDYGIPRDRAGTMYWADRERHAIRWRAADGRTGVIARGRFRDIRFLTVTPGGTVYFVDLTDLIRVTPDGRMTTVARRLSKKDERHAVQGIWTDAAGNVYAADSAGRQVKRVDGAGRVSVVAESPFPWMPAGGGFAPNGDLWLLEWSITNQSRVRKVRRR